MFLIPSTKQLSMSIACCFANIHRIFVKMKQSFPISRCHSECIQFPTASCEGGLAKTCGQQGAGLKKGWLPCLHEGAHLFNPVRRSRNRKEASPCRSKNTCSPSEGRVGRNCMRTNGIVCYMRNLFHLYKSSLLNSLYSARYLSSTSCLGISANTGWLFSPAPGLPQPTPI